MATPFARLLVGEAEDGVAGAAHLEGAGLLQVLALEEELGAGELVDEARGQDRRAVDVGPDALVRGQHVVLGRDVEILGGVDGHGQAAFCSAAAAVPR